jgi:DNA-binding transcriptional ArsR family regulator
MDTPRGFIRTPSTGPQALQRGRAVVRPAGPDPVFAALADPTRRHLVELLGERGAMTATELAREVAVTRQAIAKHLAALADAGLAASTREGRDVRYRLTPEPLSDAMAWMAEVGGNWDDRLAALKRHIERRSG